MAVSAADIPFKHYKAPDLLAARRFFARVAEGRYELGFPDIGLTFVASQLHRGRDQDLLGELTAKTTLAGAKVIDGVLGSAAFNFSNQQARAARAAFLADRSGVRDMDWTGAIEMLCLLVIQAEAEGEPIRPLADHPLPEPDATWDVSGIPILRRHPMILFGDGGCVAGDTVLQGPDGDATFADLCQRGRPVRVWSLNEQGQRVVAVAESPFQKGVADLYRVTFASGRSVIVTEDHRFLGPDGWVRLRDASVGSRLAVWTPSLQGSSQDTVRPTSVEGDGRSRETALDYRVGYRTYSHSDGGLLLVAQDSGQVLAPSPVDVLGRNHSWHADDRVGGGIGSHGRSSRHPSRTHCAQAGLSVAIVESGAAAWHATPHSENSASRQPFQRAMRQTRLAGEWSQSGGRGAVGPCVGSSQWVPPASLYYETVSAISYVETAVYYDISVQGTENYLANGLWHHNSAKSYLALHIASTLAQRGIRVLYADWEFSGEDHRERLGRLCGPMVPRDTLDYVRCSAPLVAEAQRLQAHIAKRQIEYLICDSIAFAVPGRPEEAENASAYYRAVRFLGIGSLHLAHITKSLEHGEDKPFGSAFWSNGARSLWFCKRSDEAEQTDAVEIALLHKKSNTGKKLSARGVRFSFGQERTLVTPFDVAANAELAAKLPLRQRIRAELTGGALSTEDLAERLGVPANSIRAQVSRHQGSGLIRLVDGRIGLAEVRRQDEEAF